MSDFETEIKQIFIEEALQLLGDAEECFLELEKNPGDSDLLNKIFRVAHNIKGSAKGAGFIEVGEFTHHLETLLLKVKNREIPIDLDLIGLLLRCNDHLKMMINGLFNEENAKQYDSTSLLNQIQDALNQKKPEQTIRGFHSFEDAEPIPIQTIIDQTKIATNQGTSGEKSAKKTPESIRVNLSRVEKLINYIGELVILQAELREQTIESPSLSLRRTVRQLSKVTKEVQDMSMSMRMVPIKPLFQKLQRIIRDTSDALGKKIDVKILGDETEMDKTVLEGISDPLVHLVRNAIDHGIETPKERLEAGKNEIGNIKLYAFHQSGKLIIEVSDDGNGLNPEKLRKVAISKGLLSPNQNLTDLQSYDLIFLPGFSTKSEVSDVSGRGVGMDVVKTNISDLSGNIDIESTIGKGSTFRITLPLTLAIIDGLLTTVSKDRFIVPLSHVRETFRVMPSDLQHKSGMGTVLMLRGEVLPAFELTDLLRSRSPSRSNKTAIAIVVKSSYTSQNFAVVVDDIVGQLQVVVKQLGTDIQHLKGFSGSTILGDGRPALILELQDLLQTNKAISGKQAKIAS